MKLFNKTWKLAIAGAIVGVLAALLAFFGNPANMAICVACFIRDTAGALSLHSATPVQYFRPEIVGFVVGAFIISLITKEYKATAGSAPMIRFLLGMIMMIGALVFLGMLLGAAFTHNFGLAGAAAKAATETEAAVAGGTATAGKAAVIACIIVLFIIAVTNKRNLKRGK